MRSTRTRRTSRRIRNTAVTLGVAGATVLGLGVGPAQAKAAYYNATYYSSACHFGIRATVNFKTYGDVFRIYDDCADGHAVAVNRLINGSSSMYYHRGGAGTHKVLNDDISEGKRFRFRACVEFGDTVRCGAWEDAIA